MVHWEPTSDLRLSRIEGGGGRPLGESIQQKWILMEWELDEAPDKYQEWRTVQIGSFPVCMEVLHWVELK